MNKIVI